MMTAVAARELRDGEVVFVGIGLPNLACNLARATHAPNLVLIYESGAIGAEPERLPVSIGDPSLVTGSLMVCGMADVFQCLLQNGRIEVGFLGGAQIDRYGNINTTVVGDYAHPTVRLPGSGGAAEIAIHARRTLVVSRLSRRAFPESGGFRHQSRPSHSRGLAASELGMPGAGPVRVVTDKGILEADAETGELVLAAPLSRCRRSTRSARASAGRSESRDAPRPDRSADPAGTDACCAKCSIPRGSTSRADDGDHQPHRARPRLPRTLGLRDLVLFNIVAVLSLRWLATAAAAGPSSLTLWVLAALLFFVPQGLAVSDLSARYPEEGGIYFWTKRTFGEGHGFLCGWCYWVNNILYYPNLLMSTAVVGHLRHRPGRHRDGERLDLRARRPR